MSDDHTIEPRRWIPLHDRDTSRVLPAGADYIMDEPTENLMHTLTVALENGAVGADMNCPYEDRSFTEQDAPDCRRFGGEDPRVSEKCLAVQAFDGWGIDCLEVGDAVFHPARYPIPVTYRWEGWGDDADFYVTPEPTFDQLLFPQADLKPYLDQMAADVRALASVAGIPPEVPLVDCSDMEAGPASAVLDDVAHADEDPVEVLPGVSRIVMQYSDVTYEVEIRKVQR